MIDVKALTDEELWLLMCGMEELELHDGMRHNREKYVEGIVDQAGDIREALEIESNERKLDCKRWEAPPECDDCGIRTTDLIRKGDHHGGMKTVCKDRNACHARSG
jgi:hypothetical protein